MDQAAAREDEHPLPSGEPGSLAEGEPGAAWIHSLAGEWQSRWQRVQYPQARCGAALLK